MLVELKETIEHMRKQVSQSQDDIQAISHRIASDLVNRGMLTNSLLNRVTKQELEDAMPDLDKLEFKMMEKI